MPTISLVNSVIKQAANSTEGSSGFTTSAIDTTGANFLIMSCAGNDLSVVSDSKGNTWTALTQSSYASGFNKFYYAKNPTVGSGHTFTIGSNSYAAISVLAFSGVDTSSPFDQFSQFVDYITVATIQPGSVTPSLNNELLVTMLGGGKHGLTKSINSSFTIVHQFPSFSTGDILAVAYKVQTTAGAENPTWTASDTSGNNTRASIATFKVQTSQNLTASLGGSVTATGAAVKAGAKPSAGSVTGNGVVRRSASAFRSGSLTMISTLIKAALRLFGGSSTANGIAGRMPQRSATGSTTSTGNTVRVPMLNKGGSLTGAGAVLRLLTIFRGGVLTAASVILKSIVAHLAASIGMSGIARRLAARAAAGSITGAATVDPITVALFTLTGSLTVSAAISRLTGKNAPATITASSAVSTSITKRAAGFLTAIGTPIKTAYRSLIGSSTGSGAIARQSQKPLGGLITPSGIGARLMTKHLAGSVVASSVVVAFNLIYLTLGSIITATGKAQRSITRQLASSLSPTAIIARIAARRAAGQLTPARVLNTAKSASVRIFAAITLSGRAIRNPSKYLSGSTEPSGFVARALPFLVAGEIVATSSLQLLKITLLVISRSIVPSGSLSATLTKALFTTLSIGGLAVNSVSRSVSGSLTGTSNLLVARSKVVGGQIIASGVLPARRLFVNLFGLLVPQGLAPKLYARAVSGSITPGGSIGRRVLQTVSRIIALAGERVSRVFPGTPKPLVVRLSAESVITVRLSEEIV